MRFQIQHTTRYSYQEMVGFSEHLILLRPREDHHARVEQFDLRFMPSARVRWIRDMHENHIAVAQPEGQSKQFVIRVEAVVAMHQDNPFDFLLAGHATHFPFPYHPVERHALLPYLEQPGQVPDAAVVAWLEANAGSGWTGGTVDVLARLNQSLHASLAYSRREEAGIRTPAQTLLQGGSCRDFSVLFIACARRLGLAARFVSGYLHVHGSDTGRAENAMHAWVEVYLPGAGWKGVDPTNGIFCTGDFIPVAVSADPEWANPIQGGYVSPVKVENELNATVEVKRLD
ncbi:MAG: transglutaminase family protein [Candidatus Methylacidiphilales bacterium]|nr:transglutaminase family protein [Candidatus Methylacidiphilales bacterium]